MLYLVVSISVTKYASNDSALLCPCLVQVVCYYLIIFVLVNKRIQARGYQNM